MTVRPMQQQQQHLLQDFWFKLVDLACTADWKVATLSAVCVPSSPLFWAIRVIPNKTLTSSMTAILWSDYD